jgi:hypothetical protein
MTHSAHSIDRLLAAVEGQLDLIETVLESPAMGLHAACSDIHIAVSAFKEVLELAACESLDFRFHCAIAHVARRLAAQHAALRHVYVTYEQSPACIEQSWVPTSQSRTNRMAAVY